MPPAVLLPQACSSDGVVDLDTAARMGENALGGNAERPCGSSFAHAH